MDDQPIDITFDISIHSLRVEGDPDTAQRQSPRYISIHSLRVEGDAFKTFGQCNIGISIHSLRVEGDSVMLL